MMSILLGSVLNRMPSRNPRKQHTVAGLPIFAAIWGPDFRARKLILTHMFKQIKQIRITLMAMFKVNPGSPNEVR